MFSASSAVGLRLETLAASRAALSRFSSPVSCLELPNSPDFSPDSVPGKMRWSRRRRHFDFIMRFSCEIAVLQCLYIVYLRVHQQPLLWITT